MLDDLFVPDPLVGDSSNRIPNTRWVTVALASAVASVGLPSIGGLNLLANSSTGTAVPTGLTASNYIDSAIGSTQGALLYRNSATWVALPAGTNGQILQTQGAVANPQWVGGKVLLNTLLPNSVASAVDTTSLTNIYKWYEMTLDNVVPQTASLLQILISTTGTSFIAASYASVSQDYENGTTFTQSNNTAMRLTALNVSTSITLGGFGGSLRISNPSNTVMDKMFTGNGAYPAGIGTAGLAIAKFAAYWDGGTNAIVGLAVSFSTGNIQTGTIKIYGVL